MSILMTGIVLWVFTSSAILVLFGWRVLIAALSEPVLCRPVLIIESDDWGVGPEYQAEALEMIAKLLTGYVDRDSRRPVITLGMVLAEPDGKIISRDNIYRRKLISMRTHFPLLDAIRRGMDQNVFALQLHGMEHFWPNSLLKVRKLDDSVRAWLDDTPRSATEELPSHLQSRWIDASVLPAQKLSVAEISLAVHEEVAAFQKIFGQLPKVVVPPTFVWNDDVEHAWAIEGIQVIVTPGHRYESRDISGRLVKGMLTIYNGKATKNGIAYMVRDNYFEPSLGHTAEHAINALEVKTRLGRPTLLETHRFNFLGSSTSQAYALEELKRLLQRALDIHPDLAFLSTEKLAGILVARDPGWVEPRIARRTHVWLARLGESSRLRKLAWLSGWIIPGWLVWKLTG